MVCFLVCFVCVWSLVSLFVCLCWFDICGLCLVVVFVVVGVFVCLLFFDLLVGFLASFSACLCLFCCVGLLCFMFITCFACLF